MDIPNFQVSIAIPRQGKIPLKSENINLCKVDRVDNHVLSAKTYVAQNLISGTRLKFIKG
jgi:hypothetical protein